MNQKFDKPFLLFSQQQKVHPAIEYFRQLHSQSSTLQLESFLSVFAKPKLINYENFVEGTKKFIELANSNPIGKSINRLELYGNSYSGLHYNNDLVKLWNTEHTDKEPLKALQVTLLAPPGWESTCQDGYIALIYKGQEPAQALDNLVKGPTVIDCGMFTQLSIWFGLRYMLGNERFNKCFGRAPFFVTQIVYNKIEEINKPFCGNPLYSFLSKKETATTPSVTVRHLSNTPLYQLKHPGGNYAGENCIVIDNQYYIFDPLLESTQGITEANVLNLLLNAFNVDRQPYDVERLLVYAETPEKFHRNLLQTHAQLIKWADTLLYKTFSEEEFSHLKQHPEFELTFDLHKFSVWLQRMENAMQFDRIDYLPRFKDCYGYKFDRKYYYPPFNDYTSPQYLNWQHKADLTGVSLRSKQDGQSIGAIVSDLSWKTNQGKLRGVELIPAFNDTEALVHIRQTLRTTGSIKCSAYDKLRPVQKRWINIHEMGGAYEFLSKGRLEYINPFLTANPSYFEHTTYKTIALEIGENNNPFSGKEIDSYSMNQLILVVNYAHDQGGRRVILINQTSYSHEQLLIQIKAQLPKSETERSWSRLMLLLCETEDSIFSYNQFNGHTEVAHTNRNSLKESSQSFKELSIFDIQPTLYSQEPMGERPLDSAKARIFKR